MPFVGIALRFVFGKIVSGVGAGFRLLFSKWGLFVLITVLVAIGIVLGFKQAKRAYEGYIHASTAEIVLTRQNAQLSQDKKDQQTQYKADLITQQTVFKKVAEDQTRQLGTLASRVDRIQALNNNFAQAQKDIDHVRPQDDADAAPVLDNAVDFLSPFSNATPAGGGAVQPR